MKNYQISKLVLTSMLLYCVVFASLVVTGCPKKDAVRQAVDASYRLPATTNDVIAAVKRARDQNIISLEQSKKFGEILGRLASAEVVYVKAVKAMNAAVKLNGGVVDQGKLIELRTLFDESVVKPFLEILQFVGVLSGDQSRMIMVAVATLRMLLVTIGGGIGSTLLGRLVATAELQSCSELQSCRV